MTFIGWQYLYGKNILAIQCRTCYHTGFYPVQNEVKARCYCGTKTIDKFPIHYLIKTHPIMIVFLLTNLKNGKKFVGVSFQGSKGQSGTEYEQRVIRKELDTIVSNDEVPELRNAVGEIGFHGFAIKPLSYPTNFTEAAVDQKLYTQIHNTMEPHGYNNDKYTVENRLENAI